MNSKTIEDAIEWCASSCSLETLKFELKYVGLHSSTGMFQLTSHTGWQYMSVHVPDVVPRDTVMEILKAAIRIVEL